MSSRSLKSAGVVIGVVVVGLLPLLDCILPSWAHIPRLGGTVVVGGPLPSWPDLANTY